MLIQSVLLQMAHTHPIWGNTFFYLFMAAMILFFVVVFAIMKLLRNKTNDGKLMQQQHVAKIDIVRKEHAETLEKIRIEMLKREEERSRQWIESEKETLHVLNGVSMLLDLNDKIEKNQSEKILSKLEEIRKKIEKLSPIS